MTQILVNIDCDATTCGSCQHHDLQFNCELFGTTLYPTDDYKPKRCEQCLRAECFVNQKLYDVRDYIIYKLMESVE